METANDNMCLVRCRAPSCGRKISRQNTPHVKLPWSLGDILGPLAAFCRYIIACVRRFSHTKDFTPLHGLKKRDRYMYILQYTCTACLAGLPEHTSSKLCSHFWNATGSSSAWATTRVLNPSLAKMSMCFTVSSIAWCAAPRRRRNLVGLGVCVCRQGAAPREGGRRCSPRAFVWR